MSAPVCCCCGSAALEPHLEVAGQAGRGGLIPTTTDFGTALADIVRCPACGHMQLVAMPAANELGLAYGHAESEDYVGEEAGQRATARAILERIEEQTGPGRMLDVGCWVGYLLSEAEKRGWQGTGIEPSEWASGFGRERLGLDVRTADLFSAGLDADAFDAAFMGDVVEHLVDPGAGLDVLADALRPGGVLALALPDAGSALARRMAARWWSVLPTHVQYFTRDSLALLLGRHGFEPHVITTAPKAFSLAYYAGRLRGYSPALGEAAVSLVEAVGLGGRLVTPDFRDRMLVIARRRRARSDSRQRARPKTARSEPGSASRR